MHFQHWGKEHPVTPGKINEDASWEYLPWAVWWSPVKPCLTLKNVHPPWSRVPVLCAEVTETPYKNTSFTPVKFIHVTWKKKNSQICIFLTKNYQVRSALLKRPWGERHMVSRGVPFLALLWGSQMEPQVSFFISDFYLQSLFLCHFP